jgi:hypothetical protein
MEEITKKREVMVQQQQMQQMQQQLQYNHNVIQQLLNENTMLKEKVAYLEGKIKLFFESKIAEKKQQLLEANSNAITDVNSP